MSFTKDDGGRSAAGYRGSTGDCVCRAIAVATGKSYAEVYAGLISLKDTGFRQTKRIRSSHPRTGVNRKIYDAYLKFYGWEWIPTMSIGSGCKVHLRADELPRGNVIVRLSGHVAAVLDGVLHDTYDCSRGGTRCVYGYYRRKEAPTSE